MYGDRTAILILVQDTVVEAVNLQVHANLNAGKMIIVSDFSQVQQTTGQEQHCSHVMESDACSREEREREGGREGGREIAKSTSLIIYLINFNH